ncbi:hypothetical protein SBRCBS47491_006927 [Sporothrix bragantina]|uniref:Xylanolytic transcriptional activator regulatory domain-containing protein n=1 Tax=Sporothrix bragantina TaxID=671064 RepID=A0ABP0C926_9PEZI
MQTATRQALAESKFLRLPNLDLLCAYVLLLTSMLPTTDSPSLWIMLGTAVRLAQAQGLHRDGAALGLSPFDTEMRRRLWWYIVSLESRLTEIMGAESTLPVTTSTLLPCNINDSDLDPDMTAMPAVGPGASDMMFCLVEYETVRFLQRRDPRVDRVERVKPVDRNNATSNNAAQATGAGVDTRQIVTVSGLERYLEDTFLRFCDPVIPLHLLTTAVARSLIFKLRQMGHRGQSSQSSQSYRSSFHKQILKTAARTISYDNLIHTNPSLAGFQWHVHFWFPWGSPIFVLKIMATLRTAEEWDADVQAAWQQIEALHEHHPEFSAFDADKPEYLVVGELTLKAWAARESIFGMPAPYSWQQRKDTSHGKFWRHEWL